MKIPVETKPAFWGFVAGAAALAIVGFNWGGWVTGGTAEADATKRSKAAVVGALAPLCVEKFKAAPDVVANRAALKKSEAWAHTEFIEKGGWAAQPGASPEQATAVARACAELLVA
jgi:hypothetical protein